ncbi:Cyclin-dependent kinases regulatory subunit, putative, partial [Entamoeba histolytica HM-1:IMSS-A]
PYYSDRYKDDQYEYRHVILPDEMAAKLIKDHLMTEDEWRKLGIQQSVGWVHYDIFKPEPNVLLFRRKRTDI